MRHSLKHSGFRCLDASDNHSQIRLTPPLTLSEDQKLPLHHELNKQLTQYTMVIPLSNTESRSTKRMAALCATKQKTWYNAYNWCRNRIISRDRYFIIVAFRGDEIRWALVWKEQTVDLHILKMYVQLYQKCSASKLDLKTFVTNLLERNWNNTREWHTNQPYDESDQGKWSLAVTRLLF